jgi:Ice-binding-like
MKVPLSRSWIPLLLAGLLLPSVIARGSSDPSDTDPTVFGDGIYKKFNLDLGYAGRTHRWSIFTYGAGTSSSPFTALDVSGSDKKTVSIVESDVALAGVYSRLNVSNYGIVNGDRYEQTTSSETKSGNGAINGSRISNASTNSLLNGGVTSLKNVSNSAFGLAVTSGSPTNISLSGGSMTINNNPFGGKYVMKLTNFVLDNKSTLTLNGAAGSAFIINVSNNFSLANQSKIVLTGGLTPSDVLFNVRGSSGTFSIASGSLFQGTLLAYNSTSSTQRTLTVSGKNTLANGELIANKVIVSNGAHVKKPKKMSRDNDDDDDEGDHGHK